MRVSPRAGGGIGCVGLVLILGLSYLTGENPLNLLMQLSSDPSTMSVPESVPGPAAPSGYDPEVDFVAVVLGETEYTWNQIFARRGSRYVSPTLVLFTDAVESACGFNSSAVGPFYCPADRKVYLDLSFFQELGRRFGAPGDFAQAYVIAHEVGHHVQNLLGVSEQVHRMRGGLTKAEYNTLSVRQELQADCFAGVWSHHASREQNLLEEGDVEEGLRAAQAIGDDMIQRKASGQINPESFTHGTSEQRVRWLRRGLRLGRIDECNTFEADPL